MRVSRTSDSSVLWGRQLRSSSTRKQKFSVLRSRRSKYWCGPPKLRERVPFGAWTSDFAIFSDSGAPASLLLLCYLSISFTESTGGLPHFCPVEGFSSVITSSAAVPCGITPCLTVAVTSKLPS